MTRDVMRRFHITVANKINIYGLVSPLSSICQKYDMHAVPKGVTCGQERLTQKYVN